MYCESQITCTLVLSVIPVPVGITIFVEIIGSMIGCIITWHVRCWCFVRPYALNCTQTKPKTKLTKSAT